MSEVVMAGGCQCGAVRYELSAQPKTEFCHCRMCQRAVGGVFAALSGVKKTEFRWTKGEPSFFASSTLSQRGFCAACGTPLTFAYNDKDSIEVTTGSLDDPERAPIEAHFGIESKVSWLQLCDGLPEHSTGESPDSMVHRPEFQSRQDAGR